jgi:hypothetical protein
MDIVLSHLTMFAASAFAIWREVAPWLLAGLIIAGVLKAFFPTQLLSRLYLSLPAELDVWPNRHSHRNSDPWLVQNHDRIRLIRPRLLVLNFSNNRDMAWIRRRTDETIRALAESTRYHGFKDPQAPAFLQYEVAKYVDLRDQPVPADRLYPRRSGRLTRPERVWSSPRNAL